MENMNNTVVETNVGGTNNSSSNYRVELVATIGGDSSSNNNNSKINVINNSGDNRIKQEDILPEVSKAEVMKELPLIVRCIASILCLFEKDTNPIKILLKYLAIATTLFGGLAASLNLKETMQKDGSIHVVPSFSLRSIGFFACFCLYAPVSIVSIQKYFNGNIGRVKLLHSWRLLSNSGKKKATTYTNRSFRGWLFYFLINLLGTIDQSRPKNESFRIFSYIQSFCTIYSFSIGFILYFSLLIFITIVETEIITSELQKMSKEMETLIFKSAQDNQMNNTEESKRVLLSRSNGRELMKRLVYLSDNVANKARRPVKLIGTSLALIVLSLILLITCYIIEAVLYSVEGKNVDIISLIVLQPLWMGGLYVFLHLSIKPSVCYRKFIEKLHKGDSLLILSECFSGDQLTLKYFFDGLEMQQKYLVWRYFIPGRGNVSVTYNLYQQILSSLAGVLVASIAFVLRQLGSLRES